MAKVTPYLHVEIDLSRPPVQEISAVIAAVLQSYPGQDRDILTGLRDEIDKHLQYMDKEGDNRGEKVSEISRG